MRALTHLYFTDDMLCRRFSRNEVLAREGIDTFVRPAAASFCTSCRNEVLAREGIDTIYFMVPNREAHWA